MARKHHRKSPASVTFDPPDPELPEHVIGMLSRLFDDPAEIPVRVRHNVLVVRKRKNSGAT